MVYLDVLAGIWILQREFRQVNFTFLDLNFLICKMASFVSKPQESMCFCSLWIMSILGPVFPCMVESQGLGGELWSQMA